MRSFVFFSTFVLSFALFQLVAARATNQQKRAEQDTSPNGVVNFIRDLFGLTARQEQVCVEDDIYTEVHNYPYANEFCNRFLGNSPNVVAVYATPATTVTNTYTTITATTTNTVRVAVTASVDVATNGKAKRNLVRNRFDSGAVARFIRVAEDNGTATADPTFISAITSACSCQVLTPLTTTATYTESVSIFTRSAYANTIQTVNTTITSGTVTATITAAVQVSSEVVVPASPSQVGQVPSADVASSTSVSSTAASPTPTSPAIVCPDDNNTIDSQLIDGQLFQYLVQCDTDLTDDNLAQYRYETFTECAAACGSANYGFSSAVCQGAVFYPGATSGSNCFLKKSANSTVVAGGINAVILQRIEVAVTDSTAPTPVYLTSSTASSVDTSSILSSILQNSTTSIPIITPAAVRNERLATSYSTYVSGGSTYSSALVYSTYASSNGSWYESYYTTYTVAWAASSTQEVSYATSSSSSSGGNGGSAGGANGGDSTTGSSASSGNSTGVGGGSDGGANGGSSSGYTITTTVYNNTETNGNQEIRNETIVTTYTWSNGTTSSSSTTTITDTTIGSSSGGTSGSSSGEAGGSNGSSGGSANGGSNGGANGGANGGNGGANGDGNGGAFTNGTIIVTNSTTVTNNTVSVNGTTGGANGGSNGGSGGGAAGNVSTDVIVSTIFSTEVSTVYITASTPFTASIPDAGRSGSESPPASTSFPTLTPSFPINGTLSTSIPLYDSSSGAYLPPYATGGVPLQPANATTSGGDRSGTATPLTTPYGFSNASTPVGPTGTAPSSFSGSMPSGDRTGSLAPPTGTPGVNTTSTVPSASFPFPSSNSTLAIPTGTAPSASFPFPTANSSFPLPTGTAPSASFPFPTGNSSVITGPTGSGPSSGLPFPSANSTIPLGTDAPRSGTLTPSGPSATLPSATNGTCTDMPPVTVTMFSTVTEAATTVYATTTLLGCYSNCPPAGQGFYGPFGGFPSPTTSAT